MKNHEDLEVIVNSINDAKQALRKIQEKLYGEKIDPSDIFKVTVQLNNFLDDIAVKLNKN